MKSELVYRGFSVPEFILALVFRIIFLFVIVYLIGHYDENPPVIIVVASVTVLLFLGWGDDQILVYSDRVVHSSNTILSLLFNSKGKQYKIDKMSKAYLTPEEKVDPVAGGIVVILMLMFSKGSSSNRTRPIFIDTKDGKTIQLNTNLSHEQMEMAVETINTLIRENPNSEAGGDV